MLKPLFIKHKQYRDICWRVYNTHGGSTTSRFKAELWNIGYVKSWCMNIRDYVDIPYADFSNWLYTNDNVPCLRDANWKDLNSAP